MTSTARSPERTVPMPLRRSMCRIVLGGCLAMVFSTGVGSPLTTEFYRHLGAHEAHFGLINGLPLILLAAQFVGAVMVNRVAVRKPTFLFCLIASRLLYLPIAFIPWLRLGLPLGAQMSVIVSLLTLSGLLHNYAIPFWFSWMADLIPRPILNRFWGRRQMAMHITWAVAYLVVTLYLFHARRPVAEIFRILTAIAVTAGVIDILLFIRIPEPENLVDHGLGWWHALRQPLNTPAYRSFVYFQCAWSFAVMFGAAFMQLYVLKVLGVPPWETTLIWCLEGVGVGLSSAGWGRIADRRGHRPVLNALLPLKWIVVVVFLLLTPANVYWLLPPVFFVDGMWNAGMMIAANGYMLSHSPQRNRSMFIACMTGLSGLAGGLGAIAAGTLLRALGEGPRVGLGGTWNPYQIVFAISLLLRIACLPLVRRIQEKDSDPILHVLNDVVGDIPQRFLRFPVGLYRRFVPEQDSPGSESLSGSPGSSR